MNLSPDNVERWARALCKAWGADPDQEIGFPKAARWLSFASYARMAIEAQAIVEGSRDAA